MDAIGKQISPASNGTPLSANPVTAQSDCTVQQPVAPASTGFQTIDRNAARRMSATSVKSFSTTKGNVHLTRSNSQKSATTTVAKGQRSYSQVQKSRLPQNSFTSSKVASKNGMDAIVEQDEIEEEYEDTGSVTSSNSTDIGSEARPGSASSASDFSFRCDEQAEKRKQGPRKILRGQKQGHRKILGELSGRQHGQHGQQTAGPHAPFSSKVEATQNYAVPPNAPTFGIPRPNAPTLGIPRPNPHPFGGFPPPYAPSFGGFPSLPR